MWHTFWINDWLSAAAWQRHKDDKERDAGGGEAHSRPRTKSERASRAARRGRAPGELAISTASPCDLALSSQVPPRCLRGLLPDALLLDLGHEVDHDELGTSSLLYNLAATFCLVAAPQGLRVFRKIAALCAERRSSLANRRSSGARRLVRGRRGVFRRRRGGGAWR